MKLSDLSDEALLARFAAVRVKENILLADVLEMLIEIEERRLHLKQAHSTLWHFCTRQHGMSTGMAQRRILAARTAQKFPAILAAVRSGSIHLSNLLILGPVLRDDNVDALLAEAGNRRKKDVEAIAARMAPRADVADSLRKKRATEAPSHHATSHALLAAATSVSASGLGADPPSTAPSLFAIVTPTPAEMFVSSTPTPTSLSTTATVTATPTTTTPVTPSRLAPPADRGRMQQLSAERHKLQATISGEVREKLERAAELLRRQNPTGALGFVLEQALDALLEKLERRIFATKKPRATNRAAKTKTSNEASANRSAEGVAMCESRTTDAASEAPTKAASASTRNKKAVPRETRRNVFIRDERQCTFTSDSGQRCEARSMLEIDHRISRAKGGTNELPNLRAYCRAHNRLHAEEVFGREHVEAKIAQRRKP